jgi:hypothetical protein
MPTTLLRHSVTETPDVAAAIDIAEAVWPSSTRADALRHLIAKGAEAVRRDLDARQAIIDKWAGSLPDTYPTGAAQAMKDEWPA